VEEQGLRIRRPPGIVSQSIKRPFRDGGGHQSTSGRARDMTCFRVGHFGSEGRIGGRQQQQQQPQQQQQQPFVEFSPHQDRASLMSNPGSGSSSSAVRRRRRARSASSGRRRRTRVTRLRVVNGRVSLRVGGFPGVQQVGASQLVRFVPLAKLRAAARRVLGGSNGGRRRGVRRRVGRKRKRRAVGAGGRTRQRRRRPQ